MKKLNVLYFLLAAFLLAANTSYAQLDKAEKKEWKNKAKQYKKNPAALKQLVDDNGSLNAEVSQLKTEVQNLESRVADKDATISELQASIQKFRSDLQAERAKVAEMQAKQTQEPAGMESGTKMVDGVVFRVQIGAFRNKDLSKYFDNHENFAGETDEDGTQKFTIGQFRDYWEADTFKKYLREMGVKDAWIVPYKDGTRVDIKEVLEGVIQND